MKNQTVYIRPSYKFYGHWEVVVHCHDKKVQNVIPCYNIATARTVANGYIKAEVNNGK